MKKKQLVLLVLGILMLSSVLFGCKKDERKGEEESQASAQPTQDVTISSGEPSMGGSITVGITQDLDSLDPHKAIAAGTKEVLFNLFEGLVKVDVEGNLVPAIASDVVMSEDGKEYTFPIREGVKFHNGQLVTVDDVIYSIKRSAGLLETKDPSVSIESALSNIKEVKAVDEKTVQVLLNEGDTELLAYFTFGIIPEDYKDQEKNPVGTGPFQFVSYTPLESFVIKKNEEYWGNQAYLDQVTFQISANVDSAFAALNAGSIDIFPYLTEDQASQLNSDFSIQEGNMNLVQALFLNNSVKPFDDIKVRQALCYGIDRQVILDMIAGGKGSIIGSNMAHSLKKYYNSELETYYNYDPEKAKSLLAEAGYPEGFSFTITVPSNYQFHIKTAEILVEQLKAIGITAEISQIEWASWLDRVYSAREYEATIIGLDGKLAPKNVLDRFVSNAKNNFVNFKSDSFDEVFQKAATTIDDTEKITLYKEVQTILAEEAASVFIQDPALLVAVSNKLGGYTFYPAYVQDMSCVYLKK